MAWMPACAAGIGVSKSGSPTPRSRTSSPAAFRRFASLLMATVSEALRCCTLSDRGSGINESGTMGWMRLQESSPPDRRCQPPAQRRPGCSKAWFGESRHLAWRSPRTQRIPVPVLESLHVLPSLAAALERAGWTADDPMVKEGLPTAARGHNLVVVAPPAPAYAAPALAGLLTRLGPERMGLALCPAAQLDEWGVLANILGAEAGLRVHVAHGSTRALRRLRDGVIDLLIATPDTTLDLQRRSALRLDQVAGVLLAWPEQWEEE